MNDADAKAIREAAREIAESIADETHNGPIVVMLSSGYADVWSDGDVTQHGTVIAHVDIDEAFGPFPPDVVFGGAL